MWHLRGGGIWARLCWFEWEWSPQDQITECLVCSWWSCLGRIRSVALSVTGCGLWDSKRLMQLLAFSFNLLLVDEDVNPQIFLLPCFCFISPIKYFFKKLSWSWRFVTVTGKELRRRPSGLLSQRRDSTAVEHLPTVCFALCNTPISMLKHNGVWRREREREFIERTSELVHLEALLSSSRALGYEYFILNFLTFYTFTLVSDICVTLQTGELM